ncbi:MAG: PAS domain-containing sensor histidine kinase, partial [Gammaproteobacteria bacterium]|nr:PAS domain-containing sensor histidine kinase [Gammaproteobacteria bacterium]
FGQTLHIAAFHHDVSELELSARVSPWDERAPGHVLVELFDVTARHQLDRESALLAQRGVSQRMLRQLAHEIRNPLGGLRGAAQLLERELDDPSLHEFTRIIIGEADRLEGLVAGLLGPGGRPDRRLVNVHEVLEHIAKLTASAAPELTVLRDYDPSLPDLLLDRDQLTQAFLNLARNASQATADSGTLVLRTRIATNHVLNARRYRLVALIDVEDDGPGVIDEIADTIFYPLVTGRKDGSGIGLPLAQELVNRHDGLIEFTSQPGKTVFTVSLPVLSEAEIEANQAS